MKNFKKDFTKFNLDLKDLPDYSNARDFAGNFKKCSLYEYKNITYSQDSVPKTEVKEIKN